MKTGLFFGSFNPVHIGHMIIASSFVELTDLKQVWFIISPHNPLKEKEELLNEYERLELVRLAIDDYDLRLQASDIEFHLPQPSYTINTILHLEEKYSDREWVLLMGSDTLATLPKWKNHEVLLEKCEIYVYPRPGYEVVNYPSPARIKVIEDVPFMNISASFIRKSIKEGRSVRYVLPHRVFEHLDKWGWYRR
jgi:nicotinate-nucleotide adenylyltransferase